MLKLPQLKQIHTMSKKILVIDDYIGKWGYSKTYVRNMLSEANGDDVDVHVSSLGGDVGHAVDIHDQFAEYKGNITAKLTGFIASAGTFIGLPCKTRISENAFYLIHKVLSYVDEWGMMNEDDLDQVIKKLKKEKKENETMTLVLAKNYYNRAKTKGKSFQDVLNLMKQDTWISAAEALDWGFVDEVYKPAKADASFSNVRMAAKFAAFGLPSIPNHQHGSLSEVEGQSPITSNHSPEPNNSTNMKSLVLPRLNAVLKIDAIAIDEENGSYLLETQITEIESTIENLAAQVTDKENTIASLTQQATDTTQQLNAITASVTERDQTIAANQTELESLRTNVAQLQPLTDQVNELTQTVTDRENEAVALNAQIAALTDRITKNPGSRVLNFSATPKEQNGDGVDWDAINSLPHNQEVK
jgi:ATP-dependent protease ClpP protease subunit/uncharacterized coiled-coil protein SlyX